ncbi:lactose-binding lectin l-2 [Maylandia zebra]|uniref:lactose-binding lectin l-2 n=1 Tax=Maylandia zebra TaxID=106582 RepID=UPI000329E4E9
MILFLFLFLFSLDNQTVKLLRGNCPMFWYSFNGRCYKYVATQMTWADAELYCVSEKANLVSIYSEEEEEFVKSLIKNFDHAEGRTWIGLSDLHKEGRWMWSDGSAVSFVHWHAIQPDNEGGAEHCGHMNYDTKWNDVPCSRNHTSVCATRVACP